MIGKALIIAGVALVLLGIIYSWAPGWLGWFGNLPGDIRREGEHGTVFIPITSMIVISIVLSLVINLFFRR
ncbi:MAG: DUF2905 domain-containing protein [Gammaproteobacteria bacterium]|nr:DUF2905 domain-containing protein [Gammaproteobacteria bacterium]